jgi:release factor glutamine methyltransferase
MCSVAEAWAEGERFLGQHGIINARSEVRWMLEFILGDGQKLPLDQKLLSHKLNESLSFNDLQLERFRNLLKRRAINREPLQYLLETMLFCDLILKVDPRALIPRPETEELVSWVISEMSEKTPKRILDLGTGTGAIALSLAKAFPHATIIAVDCDAAALSLAQENAQLNQVENIEFLLSDWFQAVSGTFDCIVSNPPYLSEQEWRNAQPDVREHEPKTALVSHENGLSDLKKILSDAKHSLNDHAKLFLETGPSHHTTLATYAQTLGFKKTSSKKDLHGRNRFFMAAP